MLAVPPHQPLPLNSPPPQSLFPAQRTPVSLGLYHALLAPQRWRRLAGDSVGAFSFRMGRLFLYQFVAHALGPGFNRFSCLSRISCVFYVGRPILHQVIHHPRQLVRRCRDRLRPRCLRCYVCATTSPHETADRRLVRR